MTQLELIQLLLLWQRDARKTIFTLRELVYIANESHAAMAMTLLRAQKKGIVFRVGRQWVNRMNPPTLAEVGFALRSPSYVSFENALYRHGIISQSPRGCVTLAVRGRPAVVETPLGTLQFVHLDSTLFFGFDRERMAHAEKAMLDIIYTRGKAGLKPLLTEEIYRNLFNRKRLREYAAKFQPWVGRVVQGHMTGNPNSMAAAP